MASLSHTFPPNTDIGYTAYANTGGTPTLKISVGGLVVFTATKGGVKNTPMGLGVLNTGSSGKVTVEVTEPGTTVKPLAVGVTKVGSHQIIAVGAEDWTDEDFNDVVVLFNFPLK